MEPVTLATILGYITSIVTSAIGWVTSFVNLISSTPLLMIFILVSFIGLGVGLIRRIIR